MAIHKINGTLVINARRYLLKYLDIMDVLRGLKFFNLTIFDPECDTRIEEIIVHVGYQLQELALTLA